MPEKVLVIAVKMPEDNDERFNSSLDELKSLSHTAGATVEKAMIQNRKRLHPAYYIGEGKMEEIKEVAEDLEADLIISNDELSAGQLRNLTDRIGVHVIDRSQLILDIFAQRARTKEGKLQVELAQLEYTLPRLRGRGEEMSRLGAGIGTRGPGETKLETDQRHIRKRIDDIKRQLNQVVKQREQYRKRRKLNDAFQIAIVGYTNAGKSTLFNRLAKSDAQVENQLFATLDPLTRQIQLPFGFQTLITDTVGFIQDLPTSLIAAFKSTLEEVTEADFILHVVDAANPDLEQHQQTVDRLLTDLGANTIPKLVVYNKKDRLETDFIPMQHPNILISATEQNDIGRVLEKIEDTLKNEWDAYTVSIAPDEGKLLHRLEKETIVTYRSFQEESRKYSVAGYIRQHHPLRGLVKEN
ncbi:GTPase HflX [Lentibacillus amyloliquefaciens]|uniref:GTPase HflX n=1 Tax=Lentibacillus amyloliquefaciens TaxID=1472767 RepID=A0A0U4E348_9BACI|nr:GTPase HflX [Lentibacillus amyloliquefaciens]ALX47692.1 GTPase HflX [Lentibacillus amyloliquefaciens]